MPDKEGSDDKKSTKSVVKRKTKQMLNQEYIPETQQKKVPSSGQGLTNYQSIAQRQAAQKQIEDASRQRITNTTTTTGAGGNIKSMEVSDGGSVANFHANAINKLSPMAGAKLQMDAGGLVPNLGKFMQDAGKGNNITDDEVLKINQDVPGTDAYRLKTMAMIVNKNTRREEYIPEEEYDRYRDRILMRGGDHRSKETKERSYTPSEQPKGQTAAQKAAKGKSALEIVKANITKKYGKGAIMDVKKKSKKKANEELDLTKIAEVFGGCIISEAEETPRQKKSRERREKLRAKFGGDREGGVRPSGAPGPESRINPKDKGQQRQQQAKAEKQMRDAAASGKISAFTAKPVAVGTDSVKKAGEKLAGKGEIDPKEKTLDAIDDPNRPTDPAGRLAYDQLSLQQKMKQVKSSEKKSTTKSGGGGSTTKKSSDDSTQPEAEKKGSATVTQNQQTAETEKEKASGEREKVKVTRSDRAGDDFSASGDKDTTVRGNVTGDTDAKDSGETVTYRTRKKRSDAGSKRTKKKEESKPKETKPEETKSKVTGDTEAKNGGGTVTYGKDDVTQGAGDGRKGQRTYKDFNKKVINVTQSKTDRGGQTGTVTYNTSPNVNVQTNTSSQQGTGEFSKIMQQNKIQGATGTGKSPELPNTSGYPADSDENLERAYKDFRKDYKKDMSMGDRFRRAVDVVDPSVPKAGKPSLVTALGAFATKQAAPSLAGAEAGALLARGDKKGALAAGLQAMQPGLGIGTIAGLVSMSRMLRGTQNKIPTKNLAKAAGQSLRSFPGVYIPSMDDMSGKKRTQTQTQADMGGGDRGEMELAGLGAFALPKFRGLLNRARPPVVRGGTVGRRSAPS